MARGMSEDTAQLYRAVIRNAQGHVVHVYGPFTTKGAATAAVTRETASFWKADRSYTGTVETTPAVWTEYGQAPSVIIKPAPPLHTFTPWPKTARLLRDVVVTEEDRRHERGCRHPPADGYAVLPGQRAVHLGRRPVLRCLRSVAEASHHAEG